MSQSYGETAARQALRENSHSASKAIERHLNDIPQLIKEAGFLTGDHVREIHSTSQVSSTFKANKFLDAVEGKIDSGNHPEKGRKWLEKFLRVLIRQNIGEYEVAQDIAQIYVRHASSESEGYNFFQEVANLQDQTPVASQTTASTATTPCRTGKLNLDRDVLTVRKHLKSLKKSQLRDLFRELGLFDTTVLENYESSGTSEYAEGMIRAWILGDDGVTTSGDYPGGATWENLRKALIELNHSGIAASV